MKKDRGRTPEGPLRDAETVMTARLRTKAEWERESGLMDGVCERDNRRLAYQRVVENKGAAGVDGIGVAEFKDHLKQHWPRGTSPSQCAGWTYPSRKAGSGHSVSRR